MTISSGFIYPQTVSTPDSLIRKQLSFAVAGLIFGGLIGYVIAHEIYAGRNAGRAPLPAAAMGGRPPMAGAASGPTGSGPQGSDESGAEMMDQVTRELQALRQAVDDNPDDVTALTRLGNLYMDAGMFEDAVGFYGRALAVDQSLVDVRIDMGTCLRRQGRFQEALAEFERSVEQDPSHWKGWFNIGIVKLYDLEEFDEAEAAFAKVFELNPGSFDIEAVRQEIERMRTSSSAAEETGS